jgi:shikimate kinase/3-dehydroquinate synthase
MCPYISEPDPALTAVASPSEAKPPLGVEPDMARLVAALGSRSIVLVGMMGAGKTSVGRRLAQKLGLEFVDADAEIESAHRMSIPEIFAMHGEAYFRDGERRVIARLLTQGRKVLATGGGAFMNPETRARIGAQALSVWLKADFDVLLRRVRKRSNRPLLATPDPEATLKRLIDERYPIYAGADVTIVSRDGPHELVIADLLAALAGALGSAPSGPPTLIGQTMPDHDTPKEAPCDRVRVDLGDRGYDILVGARLLAQVGPRLADMRPGAACMIITDTNVAPHHLAALQGGLDQAGLRHASLSLAPGEANKSIAGFAAVCDAILAARLERSDLVLALGGGVIGDLAGFAAAATRRGMDFVQIPTSLLAQVDSSVGGKTGINSTHGKNLIGAFHQPILVVADTVCLDSLPRREFRAGYAEIVKYGLINDAAFFAWLEAHWAEIFKGGDARSTAIRHSCAAKAAVVGRDERESGERALLNLGHTFAHAFERLTDYDGTRLVHGEAVAIGLACAFRFSHSLGLCSVEESARVEAHLAAVGLPSRIAQIPGFAADQAAILGAMRQDKKVSRGHLTFILAHGIGRSFVARDISPGAVGDFLQAEIERA